MSDPTPNSVSFPVPSHDNRPLPEIIADGNPDAERGWPAFKLAYHDLKGKRYYAVQDWIAGVSQTENPRRVWTDMRRRLSKRYTPDGRSFWSQLYDSIVQMPYRASNGKTYKMDHAPAEGLYQIAQRMDAETGLRDRILRYLAKAGVKIDEMRTDYDNILDQLNLDPDRVVEAAIRSYRRQGKPDSWIAVRLQSSLVRNRFTAAFREVLRTKPQQIHFAIITDELRLGLWKRSTAALRSEMGLKEKANLRDNQSSLALTYEMLAEQISEREFQQNSQLDFEQTKRIVRNNATSVGKHAEETGKRLGIDIATDKPLLKEGRIEHR